MELLTRLKKRGNVMYLVDEKDALQIEAISQRVNNTYDLGLFLGSVYVNEPITSIFDEEFLLNKLKLTKECIATVEKIYKKYEDVRYVRQQLVQFSYDLGTIKHNIILILRKKAVEYAFSLYGVDDISWDDFELLYTEYYHEVLNIEIATDRKIREMYYVVLGRPKMTMRVFLDHCTACGGDWVSMLLSGVKECYPDDYIRLKTECDEINSNSGASEFVHICDFLSTVITDWKDLE